MKIAVVFLLVALCSCFDSSAALLNTKFSECLNTLLMKDLPGLITNLQNMLCLYQQGKDENNSKLYEQFLTKLDETLQTGGCTLDGVLGTQDILETTTDKLGDVVHSVAKKLLETLDDLSILATVFKLTCSLTGKTLENLGSLLLGGILNIL